MISSAHALVYFFSAVLMASSVTCHYGTRFDGTSPCRYPDVGTSLGFKEAPVYAPNFSYCEADPPSQCWLGDCLNNGCWEELPRRFNNEALYIPVREGTACFDRQGTCKKGTCVFGNHDPLNADRQKVMDAQYSFVRTYISTDDGDGYYTPGGNLERCKTQGIWDSIVFSTPDRHDWRSINGPCCMRSAECREYMNAFLSDMDHKPRHLGEEIETNDCLNIHESYIWISNTRRTTFNPRPDGASCENYLHQKGECYAGACFESTFPEYCRASITSSAADVRHDFLENHEAAYCAGVVPDEAYPLKNVPSGRQ